jgi:opacity protein-like surface antigen
MIQRSLLLGMLFLGSALASAQVAPSAYGGPPLLSVGGSYSFFDAAYAGNRVAGIGSYIDWDPAMKWHLGAQGEGRWLTYNGAHGFSEYNYLAGPLYRIPVRWRWHPYAKFLAGAGEINFPYHLAHGSYFAMAPGGGVEFEMKRRWRVRADYEYQIWPDAPGIPGIQSSALKPNGVSVGISYSIFTGREM